MSSAERADRVVELIADAADTIVTPPLLQPADVFVELAGEEFRKRLFLTDAADGTQFCLRPDFTIPVCLEHLAAKVAPPVAYAYRGKIFRKRRAVGAPEFEQAGTEWIGFPDEVATDAKVFALAAEAARVVGLRTAARIGDANLFVALTAALGLSQVWCERLATAFGDPQRLAAALARLGRPDRSEGIGARLAPVLSRVEPAEARMVVDAIVGSHAPAGTRSAADIAERILEQAAANGPDHRAAAVLQRYLGLAGPLDRAADALTDFARHEGLDLDDAIARFVARNDALADNGVDPAEIRFEAGFGRKIGYYTGFVFEMIDHALPEAEVIAGGRYDKLIALLEPGTELSGVGFSVWLDRLPA